MRAKVIYICLLSSVCTSDIADNTSQVDTTEEMGHRTEGLACVHFETHQIPEPDYDMKLRETNL